MKCGASTFSGVDSAVASLLLRGVVSADAPPCLTAALFRQSLACSAGVLTKQTHSLLVRRDGTYKRAAEKEKNVEKTNSIHKISRHPRHNSITGTCDLLLPSQSRCTESCGKAEDEGKIVAKYFSSSRHLEDRNGRYRNQGHCGPRLCTHLLYLLHLPSSIPRQKNWTRITKDEVPFTPPVQNVDS